MKQIFIFLLPLSFFILISCSSSPKVDNIKTNTIPSKNAATKLEKPERTKYIYHIVHRGETLSSISRLYDISVDDIFALNINSLKSKDILEVGQVLLIPPKADYNLLKKSFEAKKTTTIEIPDDDFSYTTPVKKYSSFNFKDRHCEYYSYVASDVFPSRPGKVIFASPNLKGFGKTIMIYHSDGNVTFYSGFDEIFFKADDIVKRNQVIGKFGKQNSKIVFKIFRAGLELRVSDYIIK